MDLMSKDKNVEKVAVLWSRLSGYLIACLGALRNRYDIKLFVVYWPVNKNAPFNQERANGLRLRLRRNMLKWKRKF